MQPRVPIEVAEHIIDARADRYHRKTLEACSLVCRDWTNRSRVHLFREIWLESREQFLSLSKLLKTSPGLGTMVQAVHARECNAWLATAVAVLLHQLPHLQTWGLSPGVLGFFSHQRKVVQACLGQYTFMHTLSLSEAKFKSFRHFAQFISGLHSIHALHLEGVSIPGGELYASQLAVKHPFRRLSRLHLERPAGSTQWIFWLLEAVRMNLDTLCLCFASWSDHTDAHRVILRTTRPIIYNKLRTLSLVDDCQTPDVPTIHYAMSCIHDGRLPVLTALRIVFQPAVDRATDFTRVLHSVAFRAVCDDLERVVLEDTSSLMLQELVFTLPRGNRHTSKYWRYRLQSFFHLLRQKSIGFRTEYAPGEAHLEDGHAVTKDYPPHFWISSDGRRAISLEPMKSREIIVWDGVSGNAMIQWDEEVDYAPPPHGSILAMSPDGRFCARPGKDVSSAAGSWTVDVWDLEQNQLLGTFAVRSLLDPHNPLSPPINLDESITKVIWSTNNSIVVLTFPAWGTSGGSWTLNVWDPTTQSLHSRTGTFSYPRHSWYPLHVSLDGRWLVQLRCFIVTDIGSGEDAKLAHDETTLCSAAPRTCLLRRAAFIDDGTTLVAQCGTCSKAYSWALAASSSSGPGEVPCHVLLDSLLVAETLPAGRARNLGRFATISPDGTTAAITEHEVGIWIVNTYRSVERLPPVLILPPLPSYLSRSYRSPWEGIRLTRDYVAMPIGDTLYLWRTKGGECVARVRDPRGEAILGIQVSADGEVVVVSLANGMIRFYRIHAIVARHRDTIA